MFPTEKPKLVEYLSIIRTYNQIEGRPLSPFSNKKRGGGIYGNFNTMVSRSPMIIFQVMNYVIVPLSQRESTVDFDDISILDIVNSLRKRNTKIVHVVYL